MLKKPLYVLMILAALFAMVACAAPAPAPAEEAPAEEEDMAEEEMAEEDMAEEEMAEEEPAADASGVTELVILWAQWDPADYLDQVVDLYTEETGITVTVLQEPWGSFGDLFFTEMAAQGTAYDMVIGDSQWLGQGSEQGHYLELTDFMNETGIADTVTPATLTYYGEYPTGSGRYWAYPTEGDANGWAYRMDLFEDPDNQAAFEAEYGRPLAIPETFDELMEVAMFFTRPDEGLYGVAIYTQQDYDAITMGFQNMFFSFGANWQGEGNVVEGVVNSPEAVAALEYYRALYECCQAPAAGGNAFFAETNDAFIAGEAVMAMNYFAFFPALANPEVNPFSDVTGYFVNPAGPGGERFAALGGQGISVISYIPEERQQASLDFIEWFAQEEIQLEWALAGGYTCNTNVLASDEFLAVAPFNAAFAETMGIVKDFWNIPVYGELLTVTQTELGNYVVGGQGDAQTTLDTIAAEHTLVLEDAGLLE